MAVTVRQASIPGLHPPMQEHLMADESFPANLTYYRIAAGLTLTELEKRSGVDQTLIGRYERGKAFPGRANRDALCAALGVTMAQLMGGPPPQIWPPGAPPPAAVVQTAPPLFPRDARVLRYLGRAGAAPEGGETWLEREAADGEGILVAIGDCLAPAIEENDVLFIVRDRPVRVGDFVAVAVHGELHLKQVVQRTNTTLYLNSRRGELMLPEEGAELLGVIVRITNDKPSPSVSMNSPKAPGKPHLLPMPAPWSVESGSDDD